MAAARVLEQAAVFARNLILANLLGAENQGIAATFAIALSFLEMLSDFSAGRLIVQADDGEDAGLQASLHSWDIGRGLVLGALMFAAAEKIAGFFHAPSAEWAFRLLALVPVLKGFEHLDLRRFQRRMHFGRYAVSSLVPQLATAALAYPLARHFGDYSAALYLVIIQVSLTVVASHLLAERRFRVGLRQEHVRRLVEFGLPLILNGIVLFVILQGDRAIVGRYYTSADLGVYATVGGLALMAGNLLMSVVSPLALPVLSRAKSDPDQYRMILARMMDFSLAGAVVISAGFMVLGPTVLYLIYNQDYWPGASYIGVLGLAAAIRMLRVVPNSAQMAQGDNMALFYANSFRVLGTLMAIGVGLKGWPIDMIAWCVVVGEVAALLATAWFLKLRQRVSLRPLLSALGFVILFSLCGWGITQLPIRSGSAWVDLLAGSAACLLLTALPVLFRPALRNEALAGWALVRKKVFSGRNDVSAAL